LSTAAPSSACFTSRERESERESESESETGERREKREERERQRERQRERETHRKIYCWARALKCKRQQAKMALEHKREKKTGGKKTGKNRFLLMPALLLQGGLRSVSICTQFTDFTGTKVRVLTAACLLTLVHEALSC